MKNLDSAKRYARAFWEKERIDRPYVCVTAPKPGARPPEGGVPYSPRNSFAACVSGDYDGILSRFAAEADATYYAGEALPVFSATLGPDEYAACLGCGILGPEGYYTTWAEPCVDSWAGFRAEIDRSADGYFEKLRRYLAYAAQYGEGKFLVSMLDLHGNLDAMSAMRGAQDLCFDLMDYPDETEAALRTVDDTYRDIYEMAFDAGRMGERGSIGWSPLYCEGRSAIVQCDFSCMISPEQTRRYLIPSLERETEYLDRCIYHYDGKEALSHLDDILAVEAIDCVQWVPGDGQPRSPEWMELLQKIQGAGKSLWIYDWTAEEIKARYRELDPGRVAFSLSVSTPDEADELLEYLVKNA